MNESKMDDEMVERLATWFTRNAKVIYRQDGMGSTADDYREHARAALTAALAQNTQGEEGWPVRAEDLVAAFADELSDLFADADGEIRQGAVIEAMERAIGKKCRFPVGDHGDYNLAGALLSIDARRDAVKGAIQQINGRPDAWRHRYFEKDTGIGFWRYGEGEPQPSYQTGNLGFEKQPLYLHAERARVPEIDTEDWKVLQRLRDALPTVGLNGWLTGVRVLNKLLAVAPIPPDTERGLYEKYKVERADGSSAPGGKHHGCEYFVLDTTHDPFAFAALGAYADACEDAYPKLAADLRQRHGLKPTAIAKYRMICEAFDGMSTSESERFLECLGVDGDVYKPLDEIIMAALSQRAEVGRG